ncbi:MAG TPA: hypothetical protein VGC88_08330 [Terriglobales bacterium]
MKPFEGMIVCAAITAGVLYQPAQKLIAEGKCELATIVHRHVHRGLDARIPAPPVLATLIPPVPPMPPVIAALPNAAEMKALAKTKVLWSEAEQRRINCEVARAQREAMRMQMKLQSREMHEQIESAVRQAREHQVTVAYLNPS